MAEYIDRTALGIGYADPKVFINPAHADGWNTAIQIINEAPAADVAPVVHGRWVYHNFDTICSECGKSAIFDEWEQQAETEFCPHCGAKMYEEEHNNV